LGTDEVELKGFGLLEDVAEMERASLMGQSIGKSRELFGMTVELEKG